MKKWIAIFLSFAVMIGASACGRSAAEPSTDSGYGLWFAVAEDSTRKDVSSISMERRVWGDDGYPSAEQLLQALLDGPKSEALKSPFPKGVTIRSLNVDERTKTAQVDLSEQYGGLLGFDLTVADYCIVLTLCQLPEVDSVQIKVEGKNLIYRDRQQMRTGDVLLSGITQEPDTFLATLYFPNRSGELTVEYRQVSKNEGNLPMETVLLELLRGPSGNQNVNPLPEGTQVISMSLNQGICSVNLSHEFVRNAPNDQEQAGLVLYSVVNSLCALAGINQVRVTVEGMALDTYGNISAKEPLNGNFDLVG